MFKQVRLNDAILKFYQRSQPIAFSNAETLYDDLVLLRDQILMYGDLSEAQTNYLNEFIDKFDNKLTSTTHEILSVWLEDGVLADIVRVAINDEVVDSRDGELNLNLRLNRDKQDSETKINLLQEKDDQLTDQIGQTGSDILSRGINVLYPPENFEPAKGDGVTNDTQAIQTIYNEMDATQILVIPAGKYVIDSLVFDRDNTTIHFNGEFIQPTNRGGVCVTVGGRNNSIKGVVKTTKPEVNHNVDSVGVLIHNAYMNELTVSSSGFKANLKLYADDGKGVSYNNITIINLSNGKDNLLIDAYSENSREGWVNENNFYGGRFGTYLADNEIREGETIKQATERTGHTHIHIKKSHANNNVFYKPSLEYHAITFIKNNGRYNTFYSPRFDGDSVFIYNGETSIYNSVVYPYHHTDFTDDNYINEGSRNHLHGRNFTDLEEHDLKATSFKAHGDPTRSTMYKSGDGMYDAWNINTVNSPLFVGRYIDGKTTSRVMPTGHAEFKSLDIESQPNWRIATLSEGWQNVYPEVNIGYKINSLGEVTFRGELRTLTAKSGYAQLFFLEDGYCPEENRHIPSVKLLPDKTIVPVMLEILTSGSVRLYNTSLGSNERLLLDNIRFTTR